MTQFKHVTITGGTHGNESTGVYLVRKFQQHPTLIERDTMQVNAIHTNLKAIEQVTRYVDQDLNRSFNFSTVGNESHLNYEQRRAIAINQELGPQDAPKVDAIIDLHTTVSNNGVSLFPIHLDAVSGAVAHALQQRVSYPVNIVICTDPAMDSNSFLGSVAHYCFGVEVGPLPMGALQPQAFQQTEEIVFHLLDIMEQFNQGKLQAHPEDISVYDMTGVIDFPRDGEGYINAMVHPSLLDKNFQLLKTGEPLFQDFFGKTIFYEGENCYPIFINEAAYYEKGIAMCLTHKKNISLAS